MNANAYTLKLPPKMQIHPTVNISRLRRYVAGEEQFPDRYVEDFRPAAVVQDENGEVTEWEVEAILAERGTGRRKRYLVKWKGFPMFESTWESEQNLENASEILRSFQDSVNLYSMLTSKRAAGEELQLMDIFKGVVSVTGLGKQHNVAKVYQK